MDSKITLSFDQEVIQSAKAFAAKHNISLSRLTEYIYRQLDEKKQYQSLEDLPVADWVNQVAEGQVQYKGQSRKSRKATYYDSKKS